MNQASESIPSAEKPKSNAKFRQRPRPRPQSNIDKDKNSRNSLSNNTREPWDNQKIVVVNNGEQCKNVVSQLRSHCNEFNVLGFSTGNAKYSKQKIRLLQLASNQGLCALIQLGKLRRIPIELQELLEDEKIIKVGVDPYRSAIKLTDYGVRVASIFDVRYLAVQCNYKPLPLARLSLEHLHVRLNEDRLRSEHLYRDIEYAARIVRVQIELFKKFQEKLIFDETAPDTTPSVPIQKFIDEKCQPFLNKIYQFKREQRDESKQPNTEDVKALAEELLRNQEVRVVNNAEDCRTVAGIIRKHCDEYKVLGFGCKHTRSKDVVTLLQLATHRGFCAIIQLKKLGPMPAELREILEDKTILKVGVKVFFDADRLKRDYDENVAATIDLRYLATECNYPPDGLERLTELYLNVDIQPSDWRLIAVDWKSDKLTEEEIKYAADTVHVTIELFKVFEKKLIDEKCSGNRSKFIDEICSQYLNEDFPKKKQENKGSDEPFCTLPSQDIRVVSNAEECQAVVKDLQLHCNEYNVLGFDCEWFPLGRHKVALLQLATHRGLCALIRLCKMDSIPIELHEFLKDDKILKVGIEPRKDAQKLQRDYQLKVTSSMDLTRLARKCKYHVDGLANLAESVLHVKLEHKKRGLIVQKLHKKWEDTELPEINIKYAANDAHVSVELFKKFQEKLMDASNQTGDRTKDLQQFINEHCQNGSKEKRTK